MEFQISRAAENPLADRRLLLLQAGDGLFDLRQLGLALGRLPVVLLGPAKGIFDLIFALDDGPRPFGCNVSGHPLPPFARVASQSGLPQSRPWSGPIPQSPARISVFGRRRFATESFAASRISCSRHSNGYTVSGCLVSASSSTRPLAQSR